jgi:hypothetical protein
MPAWCCGVVDHAQSDVSAGAILLILNWPWTILAVMKVNQRFMATNPEQAGNETRMEVAKWNRLHSVRMILGFLTALAFLFGLTTR